MKNALIGVICWVLLPVVPSIIHAQTLEHVRMFSGFTGDIQFLPGGYVTAGEDGKTKAYLYKNSEFEPLEGEIPSWLKGWISFDWSVDDDDQINVIDTLPVELKAALPKLARVKKFLEIAGPDGKRYVALICYTRRLRIKGSNTKGIYLTAALNTNLTDYRLEYHKLWTRKLMSKVNYGDFQYQTVPGGGKFVVLYTTGDTIKYQLEVYRLKGM